MLYGFVYITMTPRVTTCHTARVCLLHCLFFSPPQVISCDQNLNRCCELIELTAKIQGQLFAILNLTAAEGKLHLYSLFSFTKH